MRLWVGEVSRWPRLPGSLLSRGPEGTELVGEAAGSAAPRAEPACPLVTVR